MRGRDSLNFFRGAIFFNYMYRLNYFESHLRKFQPIDFNAELKILGYLIQKFKKPEIYR